MNSQTLTQRPSGTLEDCPRRLGVEREGDPEDRFPALGPLDQGEAISAMAFLSSGRFEIQTGVAIHLRSVG